VCNTEENAQREEEMLKMLLSNQVDGVLLASAHRPNDTDWRVRLTRLAVPLVLIDRRLATMPFVGANDDAIGFEATRHLFEQGYRRIAHIAGPQTISTAVGRLKGYQRALKATGRKLREDFIIESNYHDESGGYEAMGKLLGFSPRPDAVFAASDPSAPGSARSRSVLTAGSRSDRGRKPSLWTLFAGSIKRRGSATDEDRSLSGKSNPFSH
jgi:LacI family transcriptional regulator